MLAICHHLCRHIYISNAEEKKRTRKDEKDGGGWIMYRETYRVAAPVTQDAWVGLIDDSWGQKFVVVVVDLLSSVHALEESLYLLTYLNCV